MNPDRHQEPPAHQQEAQAGPEAEPVQQQHRHHQPRDQPAHAPNWDPETVIEADEVLWPKYFHPSLAHPLRLSPDPPARHLNPLG
jgi:hypothetical protein